MATAKVSLALEEELIAEARDAVGFRGLSGYVNRALRHQLQQDRLASYLEVQAQEHGAIHSSVMEEVRDVWPDPE